MEFTLYYRGELKAATGSKTRRAEKHVLRKEFHQQLKELWQQEPLKDHREFLDPDHIAIINMKHKKNDETQLHVGVQDELTLLQDVGGFQFAPTVSSKLHMVTDLTITLLRPEPPGQIITQGGDIDNRLKTLLDALKVPKQPDDLPPKALPSKDEAPFFCLVEDDNLITSLDIRTDRLLDPCATSSEVVILIRVRTRLLMGTFANLGLV